ncbi:unnamed protein product [Callosobruchus maculatus]|uniref:Uncharacterized protein n=1 Tax=Callosobruchus maculatus TaxID=64391 RepID=A0A653CPI2_CALMS|nr:unnamed protein product [Callosobruchus maculatus]
MGHPVSIRKVASPRKGRQLNHSPRRLQSEDCLQRCSLTDIGIANQARPTYWDNMSAYARPGNRVQQLFRRWWQSFGLSGSLTSWTLHSSGNRVLGHRLRTVRCTRGLR